MAPDGAGQSAPPAAVHVRPNNGAADEAQRAEAALQAEVVAGDLRIGVFLLPGPGPSAFDPDGSPATAEGVPQHVLGVLVRERETRRIVTGARVLARLGKEEAVLPLVHGAFLHYGAQVGVPDRAKSVTIEVALPAAGRVGDRSAPFTSEVRATFILDPLARNRGEVRFRP